MDVKILKIEKGIFFEDLEKKLDYRNKFYNGKKYFF